MRLVCYDILPLKILKSEEFQSLINEIEPTYKFPCYNSFKYTYFPNFYNDMVNRVKLVINSLKSITLTFDFWSSCTQQSYISITAHGLDNNLEIKNLTLATVEFKEKHTSQKIQNSLNQVLNEFHILDQLKSQQLKLFLVSDSAHNIIKTVKMFIKQNTAQIHIRCLGHSINNALINSLKVINDILDEVRSTIKKFKYKSDLNRVLLEVYSDNQNQTKILKNQKCEQNLPDQQTNNIEPKKLKMDVSCRWNSILTIMKSVYYYKEAFVKIKMSPKSYGIESKYAQIIPDIDQWMQIEQIIQLFQQFQEITDYISSQSYITISCLLPKLQPFRHIKSPHLELLSVKYLTLSFFK
ncbi:hypothetical protein ABPG72_020054 [Tetrahymena utriculariae]